MRPGCYYVSDESWESTTKTMSTPYRVYISQLDNKLYLEKKKEVSERLKRRKKSWTLTE